eukprot:2783635-Prymnesium_polylepis.1
MHCTRPLCASCDVCCGMSRLPGCARMRDRATPHSRVVCAPHSAGAPRLCAGHVALILCSVVFRYDLCHSVTLRY